MYTFFYFKINLYQCIHILLKKLKQKMNILQDIFQDFYELLHFLALYILLFEPQSKGAIP